MRRGEDRFPMRRSQDWELIPWGEPRMLRPSSFFGTSPWQMMRRMHEDMDRLFEQLAGGSGPMGMIPASPEGQAEALQWSPSVDISQSDREWCVEADLPGVNQEAIEVEVRDHHLILSAAMREARQPERGEGPQRQYHQRERRYGYFQRVIPLPQNAQEDDISCDFRNGVLTIHIPKSAQAERGTRRIPIRNADEILAETAGGRRRSPPEISMTEADSARDEERTLVGAKGGETASTGSGTTDAQSGTSRSKKTGKTGGTSG